MKHIAIALLNVSIALEATPRVHLLPAGEFSGRDGRPGKGMTWKLNNEQGHALAARMNEQHAAVHFNFDYEHQAVLAEKNGQPAPAAGWASTFEWQDGVGLFATNTQWTERAKQMIESGEYKYISPVIFFVKATGQVVGLHNAALVNIPNLDLSPIAQERVAALNASFASFSTTPENDDMPQLLKTLLTALGLSETATEQEATAAVAALKAQPAQPAKAVLTALSLADNASESDITTAIAALKAKPANEPDPTKYVALDKFNELNNQVAALKAGETSREVDALIAQAKAEGKLAPVAEQVWRDVGKADIAALRAMVEKTPGNPALAGHKQSDSAKPGAGGSDGLSADELAICKSTGVTPKDFAASKAELATA